MPLHALDTGLGVVSTWTLFGRLPLLILLVLVFRGGVRRGWPWRASLLATAALVAGLTAGTALLPSVLGAIGGGIVAWLVAQRLLGLRRPPLAELALGLLVVVAVGRVGCLLNGCCFGTTTDLPWGIRYGEGSGAWLLHRALGWIGAGASCSRPVHPYPLYETLGLAAWLPAFFALRRRLRSEGALLALTAAWDLALRAGIDRTRGMVNVWWSLLDARYELALSACALALMASAVLLERRARAREGAARETRETRETRDAREEQLAPLAPYAPYAPWAPWAAWLLAWVLGSASTVDQTPLLRQLLLAALACGALALPLPWPSLAGLTRRRALAFAIASVAAALLPLALRVDARAQVSAQGNPPNEATSGSAAPSATSAAAGVSAPGAPGAQDAQDTPPPGWRYEVDHERGRLVRVGSDRDDPETVQERRDRLGLGSSSEGGERGERVGRLWVGGGLSGGHTNYQVSDSCSGNYTTFDRTGFNVYGQAEWEQPVGAETVAWLGGRVGYAGESRTVQSGTSSGASPTQTFSAQTGFGQVWAEIEHPNYSFGLGLVGFRESVDGTAPGQQWNTTTMRPRMGAHFRGGFSFLAIDVGYADRLSMVGYPGAHFGVSGGFWDEAALGTRAKHPDDAVVRYFLGAQSFPGGQYSMDRFGFGIGLDLRVAKRHVLGLDGVGLDGGFAGGVHYSYAVTR